MWKNKGHEGFYCENEQNFEYGLCVVRDRQTIAYEPDSSQPKQISVCIWMTYQLKIVFALLFIYLFIVLLKTNRAKKKKKDMQERPDEALNA